MPPSRWCLHHLWCQAESVCPRAVLISEIFFWHGCNSRGPGWRDLGIRWWCSYGKRTCQETEYRTRYCNGRSSLMFGFVECEKWLQVDTPAMNERLFLLSFRFIQPSSENRQNRTDYKLNIYIQLQDCGVKRESGRLKKRWVVWGKWGVKK